MNKKQIAGTIIGTLVLATIVVKGPHIYNGEENAPIDIPQIIEENSHVPANELRITPTVSIGCMGTTSYTVNDIISQIDIERSRNGGDTDCVKELKNLLEQEQEKVDIIALEREVTKPLMYRTEGEKRNFIQGIRTARGISEPKEEGPPVVESVVGEEIME
jgi:hypothetical protein